MLVKSVKFGVSQYATHATMADSLAPWARADSLQRFIGAPQNSLNRGAVPRGRGRFDRATWGACLLYTSPSPRD
eukprot:5929746-Alexandrium_andersonii.AAC.1